MNDPARKAMLLDLTVGKTLLGEIMPQYLVAIHHPDNYDPSREGDAMIRDIDVLNQEMMAAGARIFAGGLTAASSAKSLRAQPNGKVLVTDQGAHRRLLDTGSR